MCREYLELARECQGDVKTARRHMFSILEDDLGSDSVLKALLGQCHSLDHIDQFLADLEANDGQLDDADFRVRDVD
jgi:exonuclease VII small subunit